MDRDTEAEGPAIRALASLFKITYSYLWDDAFIDMPEIPSVSIGHLEGPSEELNGFCDQTSLATISSDIRPTVPGLMVPTEDTELARQMNELGLPVSFSTNKEMRLITAKEKRKGLTPKSGSSFKHVKNRLAEVPTVSEKDGVVPPIICKDSASTSVCNVETNGRSGSSHHCFAEESNGICFLCGEGHYQDQLSSNDIIGEKVQDSLGHDSSPDDIVSKKNAGIISPVTADTQNTSVVASSCLDPKVDEDSEGSSAAYCPEATKVPIDNRNEQTLIFDAGDSSESPVRCLGDWMVVWDDFYARNYFYHIKTNESTWNPPLGMEHLSFSDWAAIPSGTSTDSTHCDVTSVSTCDSAKIDSVCELEKNITLIQEVKDPDNLSGSPPQLPTTVMEHTVGNTFACLATSNTSHEHVHLDEPAAKTISFDGLNISACELYPVPFHSSSEIYNTINSSQNIVNPSSSEEVWESVQQHGLLNSKADESCKQNDLDRPGGDGTYNQTDELPNDALIKLSEAEGGVTSTSMTECCGANSEEPWRNDAEFLCLISTATELESHQDLVTVKRKKKVRKRSKRKTLSYDDKGHALHGTVEGFSSITVKYWCQRYLLFSRFDDGIKTDEEGLFSVTPEAIARHHALRCGSGTVIDCFTGVGGNAIQFAMRSKHVIAIDIDPQKIDYAQQNAVIYGVNERIDFIKGDFFQLASKLKADTIFMSPPWGGPDYSKVQMFDIRTMLKPCDGYSLFKTAMRIASRIVMFLPRNVDLNQLAELSLSAYPPWEIEVEKNYLNGKLKAITAYFSEDPS